MLNRYTLSSFSIHATGCSKKSSSVQSLFVAGDDRYSIIRQRQFTGIFGKEIYSVIGNYSNMRGNPQKMYAERKILGCNQLMQDLMDERTMHGM